MKVTIFTSNQPRHLSLIKDLSNVFEEVFAVIEVNTVFPGKKADFFKKSEIMQRYFSYVIESEKKIFGEISILPNNVRLLIIKNGDLNELPMSILSPMLESDEYIVFGSSYIQGDLIDFLISRNAYNIHMGLSPYYRGSSCNFWAAHDRNFNMIGATIHMLSKGLDSGPILFHTLPKFESGDSAFDFGMRAVKSAHVGLVENLINGKIKEFKPEIQNKSLEIKYTKNSDFTDEVALKYLNSIPSNKEMMSFLSKSNLNIYIRPFYL
ncbi:formyltransferase family protein [Leptospira santarosai]|uniref:Formyl transferase domain protein n=1 Tax=Leptospira santarosai serovar Arenal str. MAVJ 401 TaxID=1049976 RepID=M6JLT7_9LEPT|nr:formyltransferase family protein [Leptospira santarosai]EMN20510.1 formyl transferase domain protein [Leptospira santarosai serovar Arenal str. MAVJ 401]